MTYSINAHGGKNTPCDGFAIFGVLCRAHHGVVVGIEEAADDAED